MIDKAMRTEKATIDPTSYNELVTHARLIGLRLVGSKFDIRPEALSEDREKWKYRIDDQLEEWSLDCKHLRLRSLYSYTVTCGVGRNKSVRLSANYYATYNLSRECDEDSALAYLRRVARYSCYPYFRALFAVLTEQSGLQLPPLPVLYEEPRIVKADTEIAANSKKVSQNERQQITPSEKQGSRKSKASAKK